MKVLKCDTCSPLGSPEARHVLRTPLLRTSRGWIVSRLRPWQVCLPSADIGNPPGPQVGREVMQNHGGKL